MYKKCCLWLTASIVITLLISSYAFASPAASLFYDETGLGGGLWQYDYTFYNTSSNNEYLYSVYLDFSQEASVDWLTIPAGWDSTTWGYTPISTIFLDIFSTSPNYDITTGSSLGLFSFTVDYQAGDLAYAAYLDNHQGGFNSISGTSTAVVPEPVSLVLFLSGGATLFLRRFLKRL